MFILFQPMKNQTTSVNDELINTLFNKASLQAEDGNYQVIFHMNIKLMETINLIETYLSESFTYNLRR